MKDGRTTLAFAAAPEPAPPTGLRPCFAPADADAVARAEAALRAMSDQFAGWIEDEIVRLETAWAAVQADPARPEAWAALQTSAHDLKGLGGVYGHPAATRVCASLGRLLDDPAHRASSPTPLVDAHVVAARAVVRGDAGPDLCLRLEAQAAEILARRS